MSETHAAAVARADTGAAIAEGDDVGRRLERTLSWRDGFALALTIPIGTFSVIGYSIGALGAWEAAILWAVVTVVACLQNFLFAEMAYMFPRQSGGVPVYAAEAWKKYFAPIGAVAAIGYWAGWSFTLSVYGLTIGALVQAQWFPTATWGFSDGIVTLGLPVLIAVLTILAVWLVNIYGIKPAVWINKVIGIVSVVMLVIIILGPFVTGNWHARNLHFDVGKGGLTLAITYLFILGWSGYGTEICATFAPEFKKRRDMTKAFTYSALFSLAMLTVGPIALAGPVGDKAIGLNPTGFYADTFAKVLGPASGLVTLVLCLIFFLGMNSATADGGRALYGVAQQGMTVKQLNHLNKRGLPSRGMTLDMLVNIGILFFVKSTLAIIFAANVGYMLSMVFACSAFLLLRKDRPDWPRPIRLARGWVVAAVLLTLYEAFVTIFGFLHPSLGGYGGSTSQVIGVGILLVSIVLYAYRRKVQDRGGLRLRDHSIGVPTVVPEVE